MHTAWSNSKQQETFSTGFQQKHPSESNVENLERKIAHSSGEKTVQQQWLLPTDHI